MLWRFTFSYLRKHLLCLWTGFLGVYLAGHILELTQSWPAVFSTAVAINTFGWLIFATFGSAEAIV